MNRGKSSTKPEKTAQGIPAQGIPAQGTPAQGTPAKGRRARRVGSSPRDRAVLISLLVAIAVLLALLIALMPDTVPQPVVTDRSGEEVVSDAEDGPEVRDETDAEPQQDTPDQPAREYPATEDYPADEERPASDPAPAEEPLWWLPPADARPQQRGVLVAVIDDAGHTLDAFDEFLSFPGPLTVAVLPRLDFSTQAATMAAAAAKEIILHQPMEALGAADPGPGVIGASLGSGEISSLVIENLASVPGAIGVNNHMGSLATSQAEVMRPLLETLHRQGLFFLDSRTSADTVGRAMAAEVGIPFAERRVFLDNERTREAILGALKHALELSHDGAPVVMIGHATVPLLAEILNEVYPILDEHGYRFAPLSSLVGPVRLVAGDAE